ncbi:hypothetical protein MSAN_00961700 [Mycena sanguinolenta]|uniref:Uncharacterized protein n=1 Tax=Mycena sanguinolenta TaxID=230812 RepID=A0A8H6Z0A3_9AGAR|nr:hypothetical protein MSAN_00961700 [Mycena sanguinolenta]
MASSTHFLPPCLAQPFNLACTIANWILLLVFGHSLLLLGHPSPSSYASTFPSAPVYASIGAPIIGFITFTLLISWPGQLSNRKLCIFYVTDVLTGVLASVVGVAILRPAHYGKTHPVLEVRQAAAVGAVAGALNICVGVRHWVVFLEAQEQQQPQTTKVAV